MSISSFDRNKNNNKTIVFKTVQFYFLHIGEVSPDITSMITKYMSEIEELRTKLCESENLCEQLRYFPTYLVGEKYFKY